MISKIIEIILNIISKLIKNGQVLNDKADNIKNSFEEQEKARLEAEKAKLEVSQSATPDDVLGADKWNTNK